MAYLKFNKDELVNLEYSLKREVLATNRAGGSMSSTIIGCNTRKYHGLLILPIEEFDGENHVLLSNLDETVIQHGREFNLGIHKYPGNYEPRGHKYIVDFEYEPVFTLTYRVGGVQLKKRDYSGTQRTSGPDPLYFAGCPFRYDVEIETVPGLPEYPSLVESEYDGQYQISGS